MNDTPTYKNTIHLPQTTFAMKANLPKREPDILAHWEEERLYDTQRTASQDREKFILHDGPPYANGHLHIGHAVNKILKDVICRAHQMLGYNSIYVPGWDCHGLPIEWKIEEEYRKKGKNKDDVPVVEFRAECRAFAEKWMAIQREEFKRMGVLGDWDNPYTTMTFAAEASIVAELGKFLMNGGLYRGTKPVMWSPVEKTALAEAEVEYHDHTSDTIFVRFAVNTSPHTAMKDAHMVIWTTTPWTIPANRAIAVGPAIEYAVVEVTAVAEGSLARVGERLVIASVRLESVMQAAAITDTKTIATLSGHALSGTVCHHPLHGVEGAEGGYDYDVPILEADFATDEDGTGVVHMAPGHGVDDWILCSRHGIETPQTVGEDGCYYAHMKLFAGQHVYKANESVMETIQAANGLLAFDKLTHRYPHSWRSKAPLIYRNTCQWFIAMDKEIEVAGTSATLRARALKAIDETRFYPENGRGRLRGMIAERPDWCVSRQRAWGVPITVFVHKETGEPLRDQAVLTRIIEAVAQEGADAWFISDPKQFLGDAYNADDYEQVMDILDVWFDSGSTHSFVLEARDDLHSPASLYLEGNDQHRGWFHSSLLESCGTRGRAPYEAILTHGFVMAENKQKMSKSLGNAAITPQQVTDTKGADILRLWVVNSDYCGDMRVDDTIIEHNADIYRRLRNTLRWLSGNLAGFDAAHRQPVEQMDSLERYILHRITEMDAALKKACTHLDFHPFFTELHTFCTTDLSAFYFDIRKDCLYCDGETSPQRRAVQTVLDILFDCLTAWLAPFLCFTAEEAWKDRLGDAAPSVHLRLFPDIPQAWKHDTIAEHWQTIRRVRRVVTAALEIERREKRIGSSLQAAPVVHVTPAIATVFDPWDTEQLADLFITSMATLKVCDAPTDVEGVYVHEGEDAIAVKACLADGEKCPRCWKMHTSREPDAVHPDLCPRCRRVVPQDLS